MSNVNEELNERPSHIQLECFHTYWKYFSIYMKWFSICRSKQNNDCLFLFYCSLEIQVVFNAFNLFWGLFPPFHLITRQTRRFLWAFSVQVCLTSLCLSLSVLLSISHFYPFPNTTIPSSTKQSTMTPVPFAFKTKRRIVFHVKIINAHSHTHQPTREKNNLQKCEYISLTSYFSLSFFHHDIQVHV